MQNRKHATHQPTKGLTQGHKEVGLTRFPLAL